MFTSNVHSVGRIGHWSFAHSAADQHFRVATNKVEGLVHLPEMTSHLVAIILYTFLATRQMTSLNMLRKQQNDGSAQSFCL